MRRGDPAGRDRAHVRVVGVARDRAVGVALERLHGREEREVRPLRDAHGAEARAVERGETRLLPDRHVQVRDVGEPHERLRVRRDRAEIDVGQDLCGADAAPQALHDVDLGVGEHRVDVGAATLGRSRHVVVAVPHTFGELHPVASLLPPFLAPEDVAAVEVGTRRRRHPDRAAVGERRAEDGRADVGHWPAGSLRAIVNGARRGRSRRSPLRTERRAPPTSGRPRRRRPC